MPAPDLDDELRAVTFATIQNLLQRHAYRIPRAELMRGVTVRDQQVPIWNGYKGIHKPAILGRDGAALTVQTSADSPYEDAHDPEAGHFIYKYREGTHGENDNLALRRAMERQRPLLYLVAVDPGFYDAVLPVYVQSDNPERREVTLVADQLGAAQASAQPSLTIIRREYATRAVMQRLHQHQFRRVVLAAYRSRCAICRLRHAALLDAAHILEDKHPLGEPAVTNGLGLCKIHHSAYDANILGIDPDARVHVRVDILTERDGPMLLHGLQEVEGQGLILPRRAELRPNRDFLSERFDRFRAA
jgi:putative restriction endonuclease